MSAFPPHRSSPSIPISQSLALTHLQTYLSNTLTTPYLLPNARLEPSGPTAASNSSIVIHNLRRVEAGLRGEWLAPVLEFGDHGGINGGGMNGVEIGKGIDDGTSAGKGEEGDKMGEEGWQDLEEYQREQSIEVGEIGPRETALAQEGDKEFEGEVEKSVPEGKKVKMGKRKAVNGHGEIKDKKARKEAKKLRSKEDKKKRAAERLKAAEH